MRISRRQLMASIALPLAAAGRPEWQRSHPDFTVYLPAAPGGSDNTNQHFLVTPLPNGDFLAMWTTASQESSPNQRMVCSRSTDAGRTWSPPQTIDGAARGDSPGAGLASWGFPIVTPRTGRVWCFFNKNIGVQDVRAADTGVLRARWSDDGGKTWSREYHDYAIGRSALSSPDRKVPPTWIVYQKPIVTPEGAVLAGFTRWASSAADARAASMFDRDSELCFLRWENILSERDPERLRVTTWPAGPHGIQAPSPDRPGISVAQEPSVQPLADGRLFCTMRTLTGRVWYALSADDGRSWSEARVLRYRPGGDPVLHPLAPCPLYRLEDGRYLLVFFNNDGGPGGPKDSKRNRTPAWYTVGREIKDPDQPLHFGKPRILVSNDAAPLGHQSHTQIGSYPSFFEYQGKRYFWYPDRKHFLLGKLITDEMLDLADPERYPA
ncbi:MAG TPA: sialidase family protein [Bryobacteraceae bacterium]|nr:sialidase family protein [Bryobacteraceae bacterium]